MRWKTIITAIAVNMTQVALPAVLASPTGVQAGQVMAITDPLLAVESNRFAIVDRICSVHANAVAAKGISADVFREALLALRADQLLAASLVETLEEVTAIVAYEPIDGPTVERFVPVAPAFVGTLTQLPPANAYLVREHDKLTIVKVVDIGLRPMSQLVGYFASTSPTVVLSPFAQRQAVSKDGPGDGVGSWLGCTFCGNVASGTGSAVAAGASNAALGDNSFVGAGKSNVASGLSATVLSGFDNQATVVDATVVAGAGNRVTGARAVVVGGGYNLASGQWSIVGGGGRVSTQSASAGQYWEDNVASGNWSAIVGGLGNHAGGLESFVGGGINNVANGAGSVVAGGGADFLLGNGAIGDYSAVLGGYKNNALGLGASVAGGSFNVASGDRSFAVGLSNFSKGVASVALGNQASADHDGAFVFNGATGLFHSAAASTFNVLATGGATFATQYTNVSGDSVPTRSLRMLPAGTLDFPEAPQGRQAITMAGAGQGLGSQPGLLYMRTDDEIGFYRLGAHSDTLEDPGVGGSVLAVLARSSVPSGATVTGNLRVVSVTQTSDRNAKTAFRPIDARSILERVAQMPIASWAYKHEESAGIRHIGPVSQDFMRLFEIGYDDKSISTVDEGGVALAAIKGLKQELDERNAEIDALRRELETIKELLTASRH